MQKKWPISLLIALVVTLNASAQPDRDSLFRSNVSKWFQAWELVSKEVFGIQTLRLVDFVFFDEQSVYSTSLITIPKGASVKGPSLLNQICNWRKMALTDSIQLPNGKWIEPGVLSFAAEGAKGKRPFFVMPLLSFWKAAGVNSKELGLENMVTGVFLHEFAHSQQMHNFGKRMAAFEKQYDFGLELNDDMVQHLFSKDSQYIARYRNELNLLYAAVNAERDAQKDSLIQEAMESIHDRQQQHFVGRLEPLKTIDAFFLTMEGIGQFAMYVWLVHPKGAGLEKDLVVQGIRRGGKWWSQDEGLALFLLMDQKSRDRFWAKTFFGSATVSVIDCLQGGSKSPF